MSPGTSLSRARPRPRPQAAPGRAVPAGPGDGAQRAGGGRGARRRRQVRGGAGRGGRGSPSEARGALVPPVRRGAGLRAGGAAAGGTGTGTGTPRSLPELPPRDAHKDTCWQSSCFGTDQPSDGTSFVKGTVGVAVSPATRVCSDRWFQAFYK